VFVLSTRDFRDPDLGVTFVPRKVETGVDRSSRGEFTGWALKLASGRAVRRGNGVKAGAAEPATLGVNGVRVEVFAVALNGGMRGRLCLSYVGILFAAFPLFVVNGVPRSMAF
jgi:hypothetical protein